MLGGKRAKDLHRGDVLVMPVLGGGYGACQVTAADSKLLLVHTLDWWSAAPPQLADLDGVPPLRPDHHNHGGSLEQTNISADAPIPAGFRFLGNQAVDETVPDLSSAYARWQALAGSVSYQRSWDLELPAEAKRAYKAAATKGPVQVDFGAGAGAGAVAVGGAMSALNLVTGNPVAVPQTGPVRWAALESLPAGARLFWQRARLWTNSSASKASRDSSLTWRDAPKETDLSHSWLGQLKMESPTGRADRRACTVGAAKPPPRALH